MSMTYLSKYVWPSLNNSYPKLLRKETLKIYSLIITLENLCAPCTTDNPPRFKHKVDKYVRFPNIVNVVLFAKTSSADMIRLNYLLKIVLVILFLEQLIFPVDHD